MAEKADRVCSKPLTAGEFLLLLFLMEILKDEQSTSPFTASVSPCVSNCHIFGISKETFFVQIVYLYFR